MHLIMSKRTYLRSEHYDGIYEERHGVACGTKLIHRKWQTHYQLIMSQLLVNTVYGISYRETNFKQGKSLTKLSSC